MGITDSYAIDASNGKMLWAFPTGNNVSSSPAVVNGVVYVGSDDGSIYAIDATHNGMLWSYPIGKPVESSPTVVNGVLYEGSTDCKLYAFALS